MADTPSFKVDILPLFRPHDITCMSGRGVLLSNYDYMANTPGDPSFPDHANARHVYARLTGDEAPRMPPGGPAWSSVQLQLFLDWMDGGFAP